MFSRQYGERGRTGQREKNKSEWVYKGSLNNTKLLGIGSDNIVIFRSAAGREGDQEAMFRTRIVSHAALTGGISTLVTWSDPKQAPEMLACAACARSEACRVVDIGFLYHAAGNDLAPREMLDSLIGTFCQPLGVKQDYGVLFNL